jgi:hypothetical protein
MVDADTPLRQPSPAILVIGEFFSPEMSAVRVCVEKLVAAGADLCLSPRVPEGTARSDAPVWFPDLVVVCQHWPDEFTERDVRRILTLFPLARLACCYGPWCQSDGRSRDIWPLAVRVPAAAAPDRLRRELDVVAGRIRPLPLTASRDEVFLFDAAL